MRSVHTHGVFRIGDEGGRTDLPDAATDGTHRSDLDDPVQVEVVEHHQLDGIRVCGPDAKRAPAVMQPHPEAVQGGVVEVGPGARTDVGLRKSHAFYSSDDDHAPR